MTIRKYKLEIEIATGTWDIDILVDRDPAPVIVTTLTNLKEKDIEMDTEKYYVHRYVIVAPEGTEYKLKLNGVVFAKGKTNDSNKACGKGPL